MIDGQGSSIRFTPGLLGRTVASTCCNQQYAAMDGPIMFTKFAHSRIIGLFYMLELCSFAVMRALSTDPMSIAIIYNESRTLGGVQGNCWKAVWLYEYGELMIRSHWLWQITTWNVTDTIAHSNRNLNESRDRRMAAYPQLRNIAAIEP